MLTAGTVLGGKYRLEAQVGEGGMAAVWRAVQFPLNRHVAVKFLHTTSGPRTDEVTQQFLREARSLAAVRHRNVVDVIDFGITKERQPYMVMELLEGHSLADRLSKQPILQVRDVERIISPVLQGLAAVHDAGIVHRDIKPENIFLVCDPDGTFPKLLDFGVSRSVSKSATGVRSAIPTLDGLIVGTPQYMSPEQARGLPDIDKRTDIYSVGVIVYQALTGELPFDSEHLGDLIVMITTGSPKPFRTLRPDLGQPIAEFVERAMAKDREQRFKDARVMRAALTEALHAATEYARSGATVPPPPGDGPQGKSLASLAGVSGFATEATVAAKDARLPIGTPVFGPYEGEGSASIPPPKVHGGIATDPTELLNVDSDTRRMLQSSRRRTTIAWIAVVAIAAAVVGVVAYAVRDSGGKPVADEATKNDAGSGSTATRNEPARTVAVQLLGVPSIASVRLDGVPVSGGTIEMPLEERERVIEVSAPGFEAWRVMHRATSGAQYEVRLQHEKTIDAGATIGQEVEPSPRGEPSEPATPEASHRAGSSEAKATPSPNKGPRATRETKAASRDGRAATRHKESSHGDASRTKAPREKSGASSRAPAKGKPSPARLAAPPPPAPKKPPATRPVPAPEKPKKPRSIFDALSD